MVEECWFKDNRRCVFHVENISRKVMLTKADIVGQPCYLVVDYMRRISL